MTRKILVLVLSVAQLLTLTGCAGAEDTLRVTATFYPIYIAAINITKDVEGVTVSCLTPPTAGCLHDYQMTAADRRALSDSDVIIYNGAGLESFLEPVIPALSATMIEASEGIALLPGVHDEWNPHVWVSVGGAIAQVQNIAGGLAQADPVHAEAYAANAQRYIVRLEALKAEMEEGLAPCQGIAVVTFHEAFDYFAGEFGLNIVAVVENEAGGAPSAKTLAELSDVIRSENVRALFAEAQYDDASVEILSRETGTPVYVLDPVVSGVADGDTDAYLRIMRENMETIRGALQ